MKIYAYIFTILIIFGCGTRKRSVDRKQERKITVQQNGIELSQLNNINANLSTSEKELKLKYYPIDNSKPMIVDGKVYNNAALEKQYSSNKKDSTFTDKSKLDFKDESVYTVDEIEEEESITVDRDNSFDFWDWLWLFLALVVVGAIVLKRKSIYSFIINFFRKL